VAVVINGVSYPSYTAAAKELGIPASRLEERVRAGWEGEDLVNPKRFCNGTRIIVNGVPYSSISEAASTYDIKRRTLLSWIKKGKINAVIVKKAAVSQNIPNTGVCIRIDGVDYPSYTSASQALNIRCATLIRRAEALREKGYTEFASSDLLSDQREKPVVVNGVSYATVKEAAEALDVNYQTMASRIKSGYYERKNNKKGE
jgi:DNA-directed RNA polymerase specialized sigma24 family protein